MGAKKCGPTPTKPKEMNGDAGHLWDYIRHIDTKVDRNFYRMVMLVISSSALGTAGVIGAVLATK